MVHVFDAPADAWIMIGLHPGKLTWNLKITHLERNIIFQTSIFGFHVLAFEGVIFFFEGEKPA